MVKALDRKLLRDLVHMKGQALAIGLVMASGVAIAVLYLSALDSLFLTREAYYDRYRFADVFGSVKHAPLSLASRIAAIPGVLRVEPRIVVDVTLDVPGFAEPATGRLVSIPDQTEPAVNALYIRRGRPLDPSRGEEVLVSEAFAEAHGLSPGDRMSAIINGRRQKLEIVGVALSPEYVYSIRGGSFFPDDKRFGVLWMGRRSLAAAFDKEGAFNDVCLKLMRGASEPEVIARLDRLLAPFGGPGAYGRSEQVSDWYLSGELDQLRFGARVIPLIFLSVAAFLLNVVLSRLVATQRDQIAALKAFGYSNATVGLHYLKLVLLIALGGAVVGTLVGVWLGQGMTEMYARFFRFPMLQYELKPGVVALALFASGSAAVAGALGAVRRAVRLPPAEAMRPESPPRYRPTWIERIGLEALLGQSTRMILRHLERRPAKALLSSFGIALAVAILIVGRFSIDAIDFVIEAQFGVAQREDVIVNWVEPRSVRALFELRRLPGVLAAEPFRAVPARLRSDHRSRRLAILGLPSHADLHRVIDRDLHPLALPAEGLVLSGALGDLLGVGRGDVLLLEILEGSRPTRKVTVAEIVEEFFGLSAYMEIGALNRMLGEGPTVSGAFVTEDPKYGQELYARLKATPAVAGVTLTKAALESFNKTLAENLLLFTAINIIFAGIIAFGVVYNTARIALSERARELASLRVLGLTRGEISYILLGELAVITVAAVPLGLSLGYGLAYLTAQLFETEVYRIPLVIYRSTYFFATVVVLVSAAVSALVVRRRLDHLDLVAVLKTRE